MSIRYDRIERAQALMRDQAITAIVVMNHDDYRYFFGTDRTQPRGIVPQAGPPALIAFAAEEPELRDSAGGGPVMIFTSVGGQIHDVVTRLREVTQAVGPAPADGRPKVAMQMWFDTPAFLVDLFRSVNPRVELVSSDPIMDPLRTIKDPDELAFMAEAQRIAGIGMDRARELLRPGITAHEVATEALYAMMRAGAERTSTPIYINFGVDTCMIHGRQSPRPLARGDLAVIDLTPQVEGYCANLARTFVLGEPDERQLGLLTTYAELVEAVRAAMRPGATIADLDGLATGVCTRHSLGEYLVNGIGHGIGLRFEDVYRVTSAGGEILWPYPIDPLVES